jgi:ubiquinone/menaquinone biosynthesis C-methylase UbiE
MTHHARSDWFIDFFSGLVVDFWKNALPPEVTEADAGFLIRRLRLAPDSATRILDVPCGHGRHAVELAARLPRAHVTGFDISEELLAAARESAEARDVSDRVALRRGDMRELSYRDEFHAAYCAGGSFGFFEDADESGFLAGVARALVPGGRFVLDASKAAECLFPAFRERHSFEKDGVRFEAENRYDPRAGRIENRYTLTRGDVVETKLASHRLYTASQVCALLEGAGFEIEELHGSTAEAAFVLGSPQLLVTARRR